MTRPIRKPSPETRKERPFGGGIHTDHKGYDFAECLQEIRIRAPLCVNEPFDDVHYIP